MIYFATYCEPVWAYSAYTRPRIGVFAFDKRSQAEEYLRGRSTIGGADYTAGVVALVQHNVYELVSGQWVADREAVARCLDMLLMRINDVKGIWCVWNGDYSPECEIALALFPK